MLVDVLLLKLLGQEELLSDGCFTSQFSDFILAPDADFVFLSKVMMI